MATDKIKAPETQIKYGNAQHTFSSVTAGTNISFDNPYSSHSCIGAILRYAAGYSNIDFAQVMMTQNNTKITIKPTISQTNATFYVTVLYVN